MRRILSLLFTALLLLSSAACTPQNGAKEPAAIVTTIFPLYDFVRNIVGDEIPVKLLLKPGAEVHGYEPTVSDLQSIHTCRLFVYCSGESEAFVSDLMENEPDTSRYFDVREGLPLYNEELVDGMEGDAEEEPEADEHVWTSPVQAMRIVDHLVRRLCETFPEQASVFQENAARYLASLKALDQQFRDTVRQAKEPTILVADRFPFRYLTEEYGIAYYAAFSGCSSETDPTLSTIRFLTRKAAELSLPVIFVTETSDRQFASAVAQGSGAKLSVLHSCHNRSVQETRDDVSYLDLMTENVKQLQEAFRS